MRRASLVVAVVAALGGAARAQSADAGPAPAAEQLEPPSVATFVPADYPPAALAARKEATVALEILVDTEGRSAEVRVVTPAGDGFDEAAVAAARAFTWKPGRVGGSPVNVRVRYDYHFELPPPPPEPVHTGVLAGVVRARGSRAPVPFAEISVDDATATADERGAFRVEGLAGGKHRVTVVAAGHVRATFEETLAEGETVEVKYAIEPKNVNPYRTLVEGGGPREELDRRSASGEEAARIPGTRGDALRVIETFPGVARPAFGIGVLIVRGSNPEATTYYIAGHELPLIYHFGGVTSIVNSELLDRIDFLPGNFSARYGRATGGVVFADLRAPRRDRWGGSVAISPLDTSLLFEGPLGKGSLALAARRSYVDVVLNAIIPEDADIGLTVAPVYWDYQAIWDMPAPGGRFTVTALGSDDKLELLLKKPAAADPAVRGALSQSTYVQRLIATYRAQPSARTSITASVAQGVTALTASIGSALFVDVRQYLGSYRLELVHAPAGWLRLTAGTEGQIFPFSVKARGPRPPSEGEVPSPISVQEQLVQDIDGWELRLGAYAEAAFRAGPVTITPGVRVDGYKLISDFAVDPRLTAIWTVGEGSVHAGVGRYSRMVQEYQSDPIYGNPDLTPEHAIHASVGYDHQLRRGLRVESTLFGKWLSDQAVRSDALIMKEDGSMAPIGYANDGTGRVYGFELLVRLTGPVTGWVSYTLSRAERRDAPAEPYRLFSFDQTHILSIVAAVPLPWKLFAGARVRYVTGNPATPVTGSIYDADSDTYSPIAGPINSERVDAAHQLDLRVERAWLFASWKLTAFIDVQNVYSHRNPEGYNFSYDYRAREIISGLPVLPSFGVRGEF